MTTIEAPITCPSTDPEPAALVAAAEGIATEASARSGEIDAARTLPPDLVAKLREAGLLRLLLPASLGGLEVEPATVVDVVEALSYGDGSTGWCTMIGNGSFFFAYLDPAVARSLIGDGDVTCAGAFAPSGLATPTGDGDLRVDGRWTFNSGVNHAEWLFEGVLVADDGVPRMRADGQPDWRFAFLPREVGAGGGRIEVVDTWHALGLCGTGSNDVVIEGVRVPEEQTVLPFDAVAAHEGPLWRLPFMGLLGVCLVGVPLGIGRRALDEIVALAPNRTTPGSLTPIAADPLVQQRIGRAVAGLDSARAYVDDALGSVWTSALAGDEPTFEQRTRLHVALLTALDAGTAAADTAFALGGSRAVLDGSVIQRCFRDAHTIGQHAAFRFDSYGDWARDRLGAASS